MAQRLDPDNPSLTKLMNKVRPLHEKAEKERFSNLDSRERIKEEGDTLFKNANFEGKFKY